MANEQKRVIVTIKKGGKTVLAEAENFHGEGCAAMLGALDSLGEVNRQEYKPEFYDSNVQENCLTQDQ